MPKEGRYHCNTCYTSYSVTVGTPLHRTRVPLSKWFQAILLKSRGDRKISSRILSKEIGVNKNTAAVMLRRLQEMDLTQPSLVRAISRFMSQ